MSNLEKALKSPRYHQLLENVCVLRKMIEMGIPLTQQNYLFLAYWELELLTQQ